MEHLKKQQEDKEVDQKDFEITDKDVWCVRLAGLCHDLGISGWARTVLHVC